MSQCAVDVRVNDCSGLELTGVIDAFKSCVKSKLAASPPLLKVKLRRARQGIWWGGVSGTLFVAEAWGGAGDGDGESGTVTVSSCDQASNKESNCAGVRLSKSPELKKIKEVNVYIICACNFHEGKKVSYLTEMFCGAGPLWGAGTCLIWVAEDGMLKWKWRCHVGTVLGKEVYVANGRGTHRGRCWDGMEAKPRGHGIFDGDTDAPELKYERQDLFLNSS